MYGTPCSVLLIFNQYPVSSDLSPASDYSSTPRSEGETVITGGTLPLPFSPPLPSLHLPPLISRPSISLPLPFPFFPSLPSLPLPPL